METLCSPLGILLISLRLRIQRIFLPLPVLPLIHQRLRLPIFITLLLRPRPLLQRVVVPPFNTLGKVCIFWCVGFREGWEIAESVGLNMTTSHEVLLEFLPMGEVLGFYVLDVALYVEDRHLLEGDVVVADGVE